MGFAIHPPNMYQPKVFSFDRSVMFVENGNHEHLAELGAICEIFYQYLNF